MGYSKGKLNYLEIIVLSDPTHMMSIVDLIVIGVKTLKIASGCSLEKEFNKLICMNHLIVIIPNCQSS